MIIDNLTGQELDILINCGIILLLVILFVDCVRFGILTICFNRYMQQQLNVSYYQELVKKTKEVASLKLKVQILRRCLEQYDSEEPLTDNEICLLAKKSKRN